MAIGVSFDHYGSAEGWLWSMVGPIADRLEKISLQLMFPSNTGRMISVVAEENCVTTLELLLLVTDMTNEGCLN